MRSIICILLFLFIPSFVFSMIFNREISLEGEWKFEIGDKEEYASPWYNDSHWEKINVPTSWENEGFPGYDGYAWYRISFRVQSNLKLKKLYLKLGRIDDTDMVYFNGHYIGGQGSFPPNFKTAWDVKRIYFIPGSVINYNGRNVLSVRVYDDKGVGGIYRDVVGIYSRQDIVNLAIDLSGNWKFEIGDDMERIKTDFNDSEWNEVTVPAYWEKKGYPDLDGFAWYRKQVKINKKLARSKLILLLGKINDVDQVYFNGRLIGSTGILPNDNNKKGVFKNMKNEARAYFIPPDIIEQGKLNTIAVRVYDVGGPGGIYKEYVGIVTREEYLKYIKTLK